MRKFRSALLDPDSFFELQPRFARNLVTGLGRLDGWPVGVITNNPMFQAGVLNPDACDKAIGLMCLCDAFNLPIIWLMDVSGFIVGRKVEHDRMLFKATRMVEALCNLSTPTQSMGIRKGGYWEVCQARFEPAGCCLVQTHRGSGSDYPVAWLLRRRVRA